MSPAPVYDAHTRIQDKARSGSRDSMTAVFNKVPWATLFPAGFGVAVGERFDDGMSLALAYSLPTAA